MRRIVIAGTVLTVLVTAVSAYAAAFNTYTATIPVTPSKAGSVKSPVPVGFTENFVANGTGGNRTAALTDVTTRLYGLESNGKYFPTCSSTAIANAKTDAICPKKALVASGYITSVLGAEGSQSAAPIGTCDPELHAWNAGQGKLVFFFVDTPTHVCLGGALKTGSVGPYPATIKQVGGYMVSDTPVPAYVSFPEPGLEGSLLTEHLVYLNSTTKVHGKTVGMTQSIACKGGQRPYSTSFTAQLNGVSQKTTVPGTQKCTK